MPSNSNNPASEKDMKKLINKVNKWDDTVDDISALFKGFDEDILSRLANSMSGMQNSMDSFFDARMKSIAGFGDSINSAFRETLKWGDKISFDINTQAEKNIRSSREMIDNFQNMHSETGKFLETRLIELANELLSADQTKAIEINAEMSAIRSKANVLVNSEKERLLALTDTLRNGLDTVTSSTSILKGAIADSLPSLESFVENKLLGGGILGKFAGSMIRRSKAKKQAQAAISGQINATGQQDIVNRAGFQAEVGEAMEGGGTESIALASLHAQNSMISELKQHGAIFQQLVSSSMGIENSTLKEEENFLNVEESDAENAREEERRHNERIAAMGGKSTGAVNVSGGKGGFLSGVMAILQGHWMMKAATFLMSPIKKVVGWVAGGIGKAVSFIMPKKWTSGLTKFFSSAGKGQKDLMKSTKQSGGFIKKLMENIKNIFKGIGKLVKTIFNTVMDVIKGIAKGIGDVMKELARGVSYFGQKNVLLGALSLAIVAGGIWVFAKAMKEFTKVTWKAVGVAAVSMLVLVGSLAALGALMMSGVGAVALLAGAAALVVVSGAMWVLGKALQEIGKSIPLFTPLLESFTELGFVGLKLLGAAAGITAVTVALAAFMAVSAAGTVAGAVGGAIAGVFDWFSGRETKDPMDIIIGLSAFAQDAPMLQMGADGINSIINAIQALTKTKVDNENIKETITMLAGLGAAVTSFMGNNIGPLGMLGNLIGGSLKRTSTAFKLLAGEDINPKKSPLQLLENIIRLGPKLQAIGPAIDSMSRGMFNVISLSGASSPMKIFEDFVEGLNLIPSKTLDEKTKAISKMAKAVGDLRKEIVQLGTIEGGAKLIRGGMEVVSRAGETALMTGNGNEVNAPITSSVVNNSHHSYNIPIGVRNQERNLMDIRYSSLMKLTN